MRLYFRLASMLVFMTLANVGNATVYYVDNLDPSCTPASPGAGTLADPWKNLPYAATRLQCGDTLEIRMGTYRLDVQGFGTSNACAVSNGVYSLLPFTQRCTASNPITIEPYQGEIVVLDATSTQIDASNGWTRCESASQCGSCTGLSLSDYTRTYYSTPWNFSAAQSQQMWIDPQCKDVEAGGCINPADTGTRLQWVGTNYPGCANLNNLNGGCNKNWSSPACGTFDTGAIANAIVARLPDSVSDPNPSHHAVKISCQAGTCATHPIEFNGAKYVRINGGGHLYVKYGYYGVMANNGASNVVLDGISINGAGGRDYGQCIRTSDANNVTLQNSVCSEVAAEGIGFYGGGHGSCVQVSGNAAINNTISNTGFASSTNGAGQVLDDGIIIKACSNCVARGNTIRDSGRNGIEVTSNWNSSGLCNSDAPLIEKNRISRSCNSISQYMNSDCAAVHLVPPGGHATGTIANGVIRNNFIYDENTGLKAQITPSGIKIDGGVGATQINNNSMENVGLACIDTNENHPSSAAFTVKNNALYKCNIGNVGGMGYVKLNAAADWVHAKNIYWGDTNDVAIRVNGGGATISRDDVVGSFEPSAIQANPLFVGPADLHLQVGSPAIDAGVNLAGILTGILNFTDDIDGRTRPQGVAWDIGADEHGGGGGALAAPALLSVEPLP